MGRETARLLPLLLPVVAAEILTVTVAASAFAASEPSPETLAGVWALLIVTAVAEAFPVPLENVPVGGTSLATIFIVGTSVIYGWEAAVIVAFVAQVAVEIGRQRDLPRVAYNGGVYALGAAATAAASLLGNQEGFGWLALETLVAAAAFYVVDLVLVALVVSRSTREPLKQLLPQATSSTLIPFSVMTSLSLMLAVLWDRSPFLSAALVGPVVAIALYQRSVHRELKAMRLALTDPLTGLGNHRHFYEQLEREALAADNAHPLSLCLLDVDDFKQINDLYGHPVGDQALVRVADRLRQDGEAFRIGGDEFALLLPGKTAREAIEIAEGVIGRVSETAQLSAGIVTYPDHGVERSELMRVADSALYLAKEHGKNRVRVYRPDLLELAELRRLAEGPDRAATATGGGIACPCGRCPRCLHGLALLHGRGALGARGKENGPRDRAGRARTPGREPARPRQARHPGGDPAKARPPERGRAPRPRAPSPDRLSHARLARGRAGRLLGPAPPRALGRGRLPGPRWAGTRSRSARASSSSPMPTTR